MKFLPLFFLLCFTGCGACADDAAQTQIAQATAQKEEAIRRVKLYVNQAVTQLPRMFSMQVGTFPTWFHDGAITPDFDHVDIRATQEFPYARFRYVTSDLDAGTAFVASELEFNPMTKYFYTDRTLPKKKLSEAEMLEINRLYRIIGACNRQLLALQPLACGEYPP